MTYGRMFKKASSAAAAREEAKTYPLRYVEPLNDARTKLEDFFNILPKIHIDTA
jgi:hypothetical protein